MVPLHVPTTGYTGTPLREGGCEGRQCNIPPHETLKVYEFCPCEQDSLTFCSPRALQSAFTVIPISSFSSPFSLLSRTHARAHSRRHARTNTRSHAMHCNVISTLHSKEQGTGCFFLSLLLLLVLPLLTLLLFLPCP